jgi:GT2 family glycosyltransferase
MPLPLTSIIIINYKTPQLTINCLESLYKHENKSNYETIIIDNNSKDESLELIKKKFPHIQLIESNNNLGFAGGNNLGAKQAKGKYLLFLNSDTIITEPFIDDLIINIEKKEKIGIIAPKLLNQDKTIQESVFKFPTLWRAICESFFLSSILPNNKVIGDYRNFNYDTEKQVDFVSGACFLIKKTIFDSINGFDESFFMYAEETDLTYRLHKREYNAYFSPTGNIIHIGKGSQNNTPTFNPQFFKSKILYYKKHYGSFGLRIFLTTKIIGFTLRNIILLPLLKINKISFNSKIIIYYARHIF